MALPPLPPASLLPGILLCANDVVLVLGANELHDDGTAQEFDISHFLSYSRLCQPS